MVDGILNLDFWDEYQGRRKDFEDYFWSLDRENQDKLLHSLIYGMSDVSDKLYEISSIAEGTDRLNESTQ